MVTISFLITLAIIFIILIVIFKIANTILKVLFGIVVIALVFLLIFQGNSLYEKWIGPNNDYNNETNPSINITNPENITEEQCEKLGGQYGQQGKAGNIFCNLPTSDANKECNDSEECEGLCILNETDNKGYCQPYKSQFGCITTLQNGTNGPTICID